MASPKMTILCTVDELADGSDAAEAALVDGPTEYQQGVLETLATLYGLDKRQCGLLRRFILLPRDQRSLVLALAGMVIQ